MGVFGFPVSHSRSPRLFRRLSHLLNRPVVYEAVAVPPRTLKSAVSVRKDWRGASVTVPLKEEAVRLADRLTPQAKALGAVNVLKFGRVLVGHNTDGEGLRDAMKRAGISAKGRTALVFGAGGAARAAGWALARDGAKSIRFTARTAHRAKKTASDLQRIFRKTKISFGLPTSSDIWINATPLGMKNFPDRTPAPARLTPPSAAIDLVYGRKTRFQRDAASRGAKVMDGASMLVFQALRAWEFWDRPLGAAKRAKLAEPLIKEVRK